MTLITWSNWSSSFSSKLSFSLESAVTKRRCSRERFYFKFLVVYYWWFAKFIWTSHWDEEVLSLFSPSPSSVVMKILWEGDGIKTTWLSSSIWLNFWNSESSCSSSWDETTSVIIGWLVVNNYYLLTFCCCFWKQGSCAIVTGLYSWPISSLSLSLSSIWLSFSFSSFGDSLNSFTSYSSCRLLSSSTFNYYSS